MNFSQWDSICDVRKDHEGPLRNVFNMKPLLTFPCKAEQKCVPEQCYWYSTVYLVIQCISFAN